MGSKLLKWRLFLITGFLWDIIQKCKAYFSDSVFVILLTKLPNVIHQTLTVSTKWIQFSPSTWNHKGQNYGHLLTLRN